MISLTFISPTISASVRCLLRVINWFSFSLNAWMPSLHSRSWKNLCQMWSQWGGKEIRRFDYIDAKIVKIVLEHSHILFFSKVSEASFGLTLTTNPPSLSIIACLLRLFLIVLIVVIGSSPSCDWFCRYPSWWYGLSVLNYIIHANFQPNNQVANIATWHYSAQKHKNEYFVVDGTKNAE